MKDIYNYGFLTKQERVNYKLSVALNCGIESVELQTLIKYDKKIRVLDDDVNMYRLEGLNKLLKEERGK